MVGPGRDGRGVKNFPENFEIFGELERLSGMNYPTILIAVALFFGGFAYVSHADNSEGSGTKNAKKSTESTEPIQGNGGRQSIDLLKNDPDYGATDPVPEQKAAPRSVEKRDSVRSRRKTQYGVRNPIVRGRCSRRSALYYQRPFRYEYRVYGSSRCRSGRPGCHGGFYSGGYSSCD